MVFPVQSNRLQLDGDATFALEVHRVEVLGLHVPLFNRTGEFEHAVGEGRLAVIDMGNDRSIADEGLIHRPLTRYWGLTPLHVDTPGRHPCQPSRSLRQLRSPNKPLHVDTPGRHPQKQAQSLRLLCSPHTPSERALAVSMGSDPFRQKGVRPRYVSQQFACDEVWYRHRRDERGSDPFRQEGVRPRYVS